MEARLDSEAGRREIRDEFFRLFGVYRDDELTRRLSTSERTVTRWRAGETVPQVQQCSQMLDLIEKGPHALVISEDELAQRGEEARARREAAQRLAEHTELNEKLGVPVPRWYAGARAMIKERRWDEARATLSYWADPSRDGGFGQVPDPTQPYVLQSYGLTLYYKGLHAEAEEVWARAAIVAEKRNTRAWDRLGCKLMLCNAQWRQRKFSAAFSGYDAIVQAEPAFHFAYYNALCAADLARDETLLANWCGRVQIAARDHFSREIIREFIDRALVDVDLKWARERKNWQSLESWLQDLHRSAQRPHTPEDSA